MPYKNPQDKIAWRARNRFRQIGYKQTFKSKHPRLPTPVDPWVIERRIQIEKEKAAKEDRRRKRAAWLLSPVRREHIKDRERRKRLRRLERDPDYGRRKQAEWKARKLLEDPDYFKKQAQRPIARASKKERNRKWRNSEKGLPNVRARDHHRRALKRKANSDRHGVVKEWIRKMRLPERLKCYWCRKNVQRTKRTLDHIIALAAGGSHTVANFCMSCLPCNCKKHDRDPIEFNGHGEFRFNESLDILAGPSNGQAPSHNQEAHIES